MIGSVVAAWPALALVLSCELLMGLIRRSANLHSNLMEVTEKAVESTPIPIQVQEPVVPPQVNASSDVKADIVTKPVLQEAA